MTDLLAIAIRSGGGLDRCSQLHTLSARLGQDGALWAPRRKILLRINFGVRPLVGTATLSMNPRRM
jgi:hypothetical protein